jgi:hypothetical protein
MNLEKIKDCFLKAGVSTDFSWFLDKFERGKLCFFDKTLNDTYEIYEDYDKFYILDKTKEEDVETFVNFRNVIKALNNFYPNRWDIDIEFIYNDFVTTSDDYKIVILIKGIIIYYPNITISNEKNRQHSIKDLFVNLKFELNRKTKKVNIIGIFGRRATLTYEEVCSNYAHSHLNPNIVRYFDTKDKNYFRNLITRFCTGSGEINILLAEYNSNDFSEDRFNLILVQLMTLISWESIEGTPYRYIGNIKISLNSSTPKEIKLCSSYYNHIKYIKEGIENKKVEPEDLKFIIKNSRVELDENAFDNFILKLSNSCLITKSYFICFEFDGKYYTHDSIKPSEIKYYKYTEQNPIIFRGEEFPFTIIYPEEVKKEEVEKSLILFKPAALKFKKEIEDEINEKIIRNNIIRYKSKSDSTREGN